MLSLLLKGTEREKEGGVRLVSVRMGMSLWMGMREIGRVVVMGDGKVGE